MATKYTDTSITLAGLNGFLSEAKERDSLWCERVTGLHVIKLKKGGSWRYRYQDHFGKRRVVTIGRASELKPQQAAEKALEWRNNESDPHQEREAHRKAKEEALRLEDTRRLGDYLEGVYARHQARKKDGKGTLGILRRNFKPWLERDMAGLNRADVKIWQADREEAGRAHSTIQRSYGALKTLLNHAVQNEILTDNPLSRVQLEPPTDQERERLIHADRSEARRQLTNTEIERLLTGLHLFSNEKKQERRRSRKHGKSYLPDFDAVTFPHWFHPFALLALHTGLRPGDLFSLTWQELNLQFKRLIKVPEKTRHHPDPAKIVMDLPDDVVSDIAPWWHQQGRPSSGLVFPSPANGCRMDKKAHIKNWKRVKNLCGLPGELIFYALRHDFISRLVAAGVPLLTVARLAGHKSVEMIEKHYGHLCPASASNALNLLSISRKQQAQGGEKIAAS